jgi:hypothetical protein
MEGENELAATPADETVTDQVAEDVVEKVETAEGETVEKAEGDQPDADDDGEDKPEKKKPSGAERAKRRLQMAQAEIDRMARELDELRAPRTENKEGKPGVDREPTEADFPNDFFAYERARTAWDVRQAIREETRRGQESHAQQVQRELHEARRENYEADKELVRERIPDFDKTIAAYRGPNLSEALASEVLASDKPALLQFHFAKSPETVHKLNQMSGKELAREIGRLEARVHLPTPKKATDAAAPPSAVKGKAAPPSNLQTADMETYVALRKKQGYGSR